MECSLTLTRTKLRLLNSTGMRFLIFIRRVVALLARRTFEYYNIPRHTIPTFFMFKKLQFPTTPTAQKSAKRLIKP